MYPQYFGLGFGKIVNKIYSVPGRKTSSSKPKSKSKSKFRLRIKSKIISKIENKV